MVANVAISAARRSLVHVHLARVEIDDPHFRDTGSTVERDLDPPVEQHTARSHLDHQQHVGRGRSLGVEVVVPTQQREIWLRLGPLERRTGFWTDTIARPCAAGTNRAFSRFTQRAWPDPIGDISTISPSMSSTRSSSRSTPASAMRWYSSTVQVRRRSSIAIAIMLPTEHLGHIDLEAHQQR